ncbi:hypothetical protein AUR63_02295 [Guyparkeria sp. XI15]|nr:hypothetical protein AUR63_02295 [Guyparkeria sp. XI15]OAE85937.1 hypothetical protein AWR35_02295 [Guyparkeria sp. WRN-7]
MGIMLAKKREGGFRVILAIRIFLFRPIEILFPFGPGLPLRVYFQISGLRMFTKTMKDGLIRTLLMRLEKLSPSRLKMLVSPTSSM